MQHLLLSTEQLETAFGLDRCSFGVSGAPCWGALRASITFAVLLLAAPASQTEPILDCVPEGNARPICEFTNPEDIVALPGGQAILLGEYGGPSEVPGRLVVVELESEKQHTVFPGGQGNGVAEAGWGDPSCAAPPGKAFNAHGIDLVRRDDGRLQLLVVQHGSREAVELFEVIGSGTDWRDRWRDAERDRHLARWPLHLHECDRGAQRAEGRSRHRP